MDERARVERLARVFGGADRAAGIEIGIGDDAAVLEPFGGAGLLVWTIDEQVEGTHFRRELCAWTEVGWRSFVAAASDLAAMGAKPWCALSALVLPDDVDDSAFEQIAVGQRDAARAVGAPIAGGNLARGATLSIATTLLGTCERAISRAGARPGDSLWMAGQVGLAAAGLRALEAGRGGEQALRTAADAWRTPRVRIADGLTMARTASAAIDVSDGLARDAGHVARASGVQILLDQAALEADDALVAAARALGVAAIDLALYGGEDYALLAASPLPIEGFRRIGQVREGEGLVLHEPHGDRPLEPRGFDHFSGERR